MELINKDYIETYIRELVKDEDINIERLRRECEHRKLPIIHKEVGQLLKILIKITNAQNILEIGTNVGFSSIFMSQAMNNKGKIVTIERREDFYNEALQNISEFNLKLNIKPIKGDALEILGELDKMFDLIFMDAAKGHYEEFFEQCTRLIRPGGIIVSDNVLYKGMIASDDLVIRRKKTIVKRMRNYLNFICNNEKYDTSVLPLGDGVAITLIKEEK